MPDQPKATDGDGYSPNNPYRDNACNPQKIKWAEEWEQEHAGDD